MRYDTTTFDQRTGLVPVFPWECVQAAPLRPPSTCDLGPLAETLVAYLRAQREEIKLIVEWIATGPASVEY